MIPDNIRSDFPLLASEPGLHYLDSAATSQKPRQVLDAMREYYETANANPHRGAYRLSAMATEAYHDARARIARFLGASDPDTLILTRGTTEALNLIATSWMRENAAARKDLVVTRLEHHANFVPWQQAAIATGGRLLIAELTEDGRIDLEHLRSLLSNRTAVVAFGHVSNAIGTINPVDEVVQLVRKHAPAHTLLVCDGAQSAPHMRVDFDRLGVDFYAFSGHKMLGPMGVGGLIGKRELLERMPPYQMGGDMIEFVEDQNTTWNVLPHKFEAGTPNVAGAVGLAAATDYLARLGMEAVREHELELLRSAERELSLIEGLRIHGPQAGERSGVVSFSLEDIHPHDLSTVLDARGVCIRAGHHCAQPLMRGLGVAATARASFYVYNDGSDVQALADGVREAVAVFARG